MPDGPPCLHCQTPAVLTNGEEVYPHRPDLHHKPIWICRGCDATCGCHPGGNEPLGYPANKETRRARMKLHELRLDPLWKKAGKGRKKHARSAVYAHLSKAMGLPPADTHTGMFTIEQCRDAWRALEGLTTEQLLAKGEAA